MKIKSKRQEGQVGLIILLVVVVMLTVGVSIASRSVSELKLSRQEQESTRALDLAESGIEDALSQGLGTLIASDSCVTTKCDITVGTTTVSYKVGKDDELSGVHVDRGHTLEVNLVKDKVADPDPTNFTVSWVAGADPCSTSSIEVAVFYDGGQVVRSAKSPNCGSRSSDNIVQGSSPYTLLMNANDYAAPHFARIKALYESAVISVVGTNLPTQVQTVKSTATLADGTTRTVEVRQLADSLPSIFDYVLFSGNTLVK